MSAIVYAREQDLPVADYAEVIAHSTLTRPIGDPERMATMLAGSNLIVTARLDGRCVGLARCMSDGGWVAYCADLAVDDRYQGRGIASRLWQRTMADAVRRAGTRRFTLNATRVAVPVYEHLGFVATVPLAGILVVLAIVPLLDDLARSPH